MKKMGKVMMTMAVVGVMGAGAYMMTKNKKKIKVENLY